MFACVSLLTRVNIPILCEVKMNFHTADKLIKAKYIEYVNIFCLFFIQISFVLFLEFTTL